MTPVFLTHRATESERLDQAHHDPQELRLNIDHLAGVNRWLGGQRSMMTHLHGQIDESVRSVRVLDVGTGGGDLPRNVARFFIRTSIEPVIFALDRQLAVARIAKERCNRTSAVIVLVGDGATLPLPDRSVDFAISSTMLHHFATGDAVRCVREMSRVARHGVLVGDLERNVLAYAAAHVLARTWWRRSSYRFDGQLSVKKAFTRSELLDVGRAAGLRAARVFRHFPFRLVLVGQPAT